MLKINIYELNDKDVNHTDCDKNINLELCKNFAKNMTIVSDMFGASIHPKVITPNNIQTASNISMSIMTYSQFNNTIKTLLDKTQIVFPKVNRHGLIGVNMIVTFKK